MMIRINLLPVRAVKKREVGRQILVLYGAVAVLALVLNFLWYQNRAGEEKRNADRIAQTNQRIKELEKVIGEVNNINKRKKEVEEKLKVLESLRKGRSGPVRMLDALATSMPKKVWLKEFEEKANIVRLTGTAVSHDDVAELMRSLANVVWTPKGMGRLVEQKREAKTSRVELLAPEGAIEDFPVADISSFFTAIELKSAKQVEIKAAALGASPNKAVDFDIGLTNNYAI
jgi:type IV pilus assembly protein PilN